MPNPNAHDQPVEGGTEQIEHTLQKQSEAKQKKPTGKPESGNSNRSNKGDERGR